jgi:hypothetical protein
LDWCGDFLSNWEFKNLELLVGLLLVFFSEMLPNGQSATTVSYVSALNLFTKEFMNVRKDPNYKRAFCLKKGVSRTWLGVMHQWFNENNLSVFEVKINPEYMEESEESESEVVDEQSAEPQPVS